MDGLIALNFHGIGMPRRSLEPGEAPYWIAPELFEAILDRIAVHPERARIRITFDDGNRSDLTVALPALRARDLRADFFVLSGRLGEAGSLDAAGITALLEAGMGVGSHGIAHVPWDSLSPDALRDELVGSKASLEAVCRRTVTSAGIPFGRWSRAVLKGLRAAGYAEAWSSDGGVAQEGDFPMARTSVRADLDLSGIDAVLAGRMDPARRLRRALGVARKRWLA